MSPQREPDTYVDVGAEHDALGVDVLGAQGRHGGGGLAGLQPADGDDGFELQRAAQLLQALGRVRVRQLGVVQRLDEQPRVQPRHQNAKVVLDAVVGPERLRRRDVAACRLSSAHHHHEPIALPCVVLHQGRHFLIE